MRRWLEDDRRYTLLSKAATRKRPHKSLSALSFPYSVDVPNHLHMSTQGDGSQRAKCLPIKRTLLFTATSYPHGMFLSKEVVSEDVVSVACISS